VRSPDRAPPAWPVAAPQSAQNLPRPVSLAPHDPQTPPERAAPQALQNLPVDSVPQDGHL
jgi:hypothetical protein